MQTAEAERKKALEKDEKLQNDIQTLSERLAQSEQEVENLQSKITTLEAQVASDEVTKKQLETKIESLTIEIKELNEKEIKDQEGLKSQYQRLMKEKLAEEKRQFEIRLKAAEKANSPQPTEDNNHDTTTITPPPIINNHTSPPSISSRSSFDSNSTTTAPIVSSILTERLQANIRQLENQLGFYQTQLASSSQSRDELSEEVLNMSQEMERLRKELKKTQAIEKEHQQLNGRYQTLLELLGERTEEVDELKADLVDVKEMYKTQILDLVQKIDQLSSSNRK